MQKSYSESYKAAGVDITAGYRAVELMKAHVARTMPGGRADIGGFGGLWPLPSGMKEPVLVSGTDGVGTKLRIAQLMGRHDTIGIDCVAMCVNDVICCGARPLFFLDYIACGRNDPEKIASIVGGVAEGCVRADVFALDRNAEALFDGAGHVLVEAAARDVGDAEDFDLFEQGEDGLHINFRRRQKRLAEGSAYLLEMLT